MKRTTLLVMGALVALGAGALAPGQNTGSAANQWYRQGVQAMEQGQVETAKHCFREALRLRPNDMNTRYQLRQLELRRGSLLAKKRELQLKAVTVPNADFDQATLPEALTVLSALVEKATEGKFVPNFVVQDPKDLLAKRTFSLKLGQVPATVVLNYVLENAHATARYEEHAIVIRPMRTTRKTSPSPESDQAAIEEKNSSDPFGK